MTQRAFVDFVSSYQGISDYKYEVYGNNGLVKQGRFSRKHSDQNCIAFFSKSLTKDERLLILQAYLRYSEEKFRKFLAKYGQDTDPGIVEIKLDGQRNIDFIKAQIEIVEAEVGLT